MSQPALDLSKLPSAATPKAPSEGIAWEWRHAFTGLNGEVKGWAKRLADGQPPLTPAEQAKLRSLITTLKAMYGNENAAQIAAWMGSKVTAAGAASLQKTYEALPAWGIQSAESAAAALGYSQVPNLAAVTLAATAQLGPLTADFANMEAAAQRLLSRSLVAAIAGGEGAADLAKRISPVVDHVAKSGQARSMMIARTALARAYDRSTQVVYMDAASKGILHGWRWQARWNSCDVCSALNGTVFSAQTDTFRHPNCRCVMLPVLWDEPAAQVPYGERWEPFDGTKADFDRLEVHTSPKGWSSWRLKPKGEPLPHPPGKVVPLPPPAPPPSIAPKVPKAAKAKPAEAPDAPDTAPQGVTQAADAATPTPGSPPGSWAGKPRPEPPLQPPKPKPAGLKKGDLDPWLAGARDRYDNFAGKAKGSLEQSNNWSYFQRILQGDADALDALDYLKSQHYLDDGLYQQAAQILNAALQPPPKAYSAWMRKMKAWEKERDSWQADYDAWKADNGVTVELAGMDGALAHKSSESGVDWANEAFKGQRLTKAGREYLRDYTGSSFSYWNGMLRKGDWSPIEGIIKEIDANIAKHTIPEDVILHRGTDWQEFGLSSMPKDPTSLIGQTYRQPGYWSTSVGNGAAFSSKEVQLIIRVPKGTHAVFARKFSRFTGENEMILARDQQIYIHSVYQHNGRWRIEVEVLPEGANPADYAGLMPKPRSKT